MTNDKAAWLSPLFSKPTTDRVPTGGDEPQVVRPKERRRTAFPPSAMKAEPVLDKRADEDRKQGTEDKKSSKDFIMVKKDMIREVGTLAAVVYADLLSKKKYFHGKNMLDGEGYFYNSHANIQGDTGLTKKQQRRVMKLLEDKQLILRKRASHYGAMYYKVYQFDECKSGVKRDPDSGIRCQKGP